MLKWLGLCLILGIAACAKYTAQDVDDSVLPLHQAWKETYQD